MDYPEFSTAKLGELSDEYYFAAQCSACQHGRRLSISKLRHALGEAYPVAKIRGRLRCSRCGARQATVTFLNPSQRTGNLQHLFQKQSEQGA